jgi:hypothetical protein
VEIGMTARTTSRTINFQRPFILEGFAREQPAGSYVVLTEEEMMDTVLSLAWRRASTAIRLRTPAGTQDVPIDPEQLNAALLRDRAKQNAPSPLTDAPTPRPQARRARHLIARLAGKH